MDTDLNSNSLSVSCVLSGSELMGYVVVVQSAADGSTLLIGESRDESTVELEGLSDGCVYNMVVFPLTESGIIGTYVAYSQEFKVVPIGEYGI